MSRRRRRVALVLVVIVSNFTLTACHELYCNFVEGLTGVPVDCSHYQFPDLGDITLPSLPPPPTLPTTTTTTSATTTTSGEPTTSSSSTTTSSSSPSSSSSSSSSSSTLPGKVVAVASGFDVSDLPDPRHVPTRTIPERPIPAFPY